jgi:hypothetical protein
MEKPFEVRFDFPLAHSDLSISLKATAELHHSDPYFVIDNFSFASAKPARKEPSVLPAQEIKQIRRNGSMVWVHCDSERESLLSIALGKAIEKAQKNR